MADNLDNLTLDDVAAMAPGLCKYTLIKLLFPTTVDQEAGRLAGYSGRCGGQLKKRVAGVLGAPLEEHGITMDTVAERLAEAMNAKKTQVVILKNHRSDGEKVGKRKVRIEQTAEILEVGPDWNAILKAAQFITVCHSQGEKEGKRPAGYLPPWSEQDPHDGKTTTEITDIANAGIEDAEYEDIPDAEAN